MSEEKTTLAQASGSTNSEKVEMVPKTDLEKLTTQLTDLTKQTETLRKERDNAKLEILNPEYLRWLEEKETKGHASDKTTEKVAKSLEVDETELEGLSRKQFMQLVVNSTVQQIIDKVGPGLDKELSTLRSGISDIAASLEVKECETKYPDFWEFKEQMVDLVKGNDALKIEDAYKIAKQNIKLEKDQKEKESALRAQSEKPSGLAESSTTQRSFKNKTDASEDAWKKVVGDKDRL